MGFYTEKDIEIERLREENARLIRERDEARLCSTRAEVERLEGLILDWFNYKSGDRLMAEAWRIRALRGGGE